MQSQTHQLSSRFNLVSMPDRHVFLFGTETVIGNSTTQDDLFLRFASQETTNDFVPTATNTAGSFRIQDGSKIVSAVRSRNAVLYGQIHHLMHYSL
jgi:hypothetical protein